MTKLNAAINISSTFSFCKKVLQPFKWYLITMLVISSIWAANTSIRPYLIKIIVNRSLFFSQETENIFPLLIAIILYLTMSLLMEITYRLYDIFKLKVFPKLKKNIVNNLIDSIMKHSFSFYQNNFVGSLVNKINNAVDGIPEIVEIIISRFFVQALSLIIAAYTLWQVAPKFSFVMMTWSTIFISISITMSKKASFLSDQASEVRSTISGKIADTITNITTVHFFTASSYEDKLLNNSLNKGVIKEQNLYWFFFKIWIFQGLSFFILEVVCLYLLLVDRKLGLVTPGDFALILTLNITITELIWNVFKNFTTFSRLLGQTIQGLRTITMPPEISDAPNAKKLLIRKGSIIFEKVCFKYQKMESLFSNKSIIINGGQKVGLVGYSGSGKSTFVNLILRLFEIQSGCISIDGQNITDVTRDSLWKSIAVIPQNPTLFHRSLMENIRYGLLQATDEKVIEAAKKAFAHDFITSLSKQYDTFVGEGGIKLSAGQRQRIAIARAVLKDAPILILDEATNSLDSITETQIQKSLWKLMQGKTTIVIAHKLSTILHMDRLLVFEQGKIVEDGSHQELINKSGLYKTMWHTQSKGFLPEITNYKNHS